MIVLIGESASGKSSVERELAERYGYKKIISYTTRKPRANEEDGVDYYFVTDDEFKELYHKGFFVETAQYNGWWYGTALEDCTDDAVAVLTPHGLRQINKKLKDKISTVLSFYISVPRRDRLIKILERGDDIEESYRRNLSDVGQFDGVEDEVLFVIKNDGYRMSVEEIASNINFINNTSTFDRDDENE